MGPAGGHFGLLACSMVEVIHQWPRLKYPEMALLKMVGVTAVLFLAGRVSSLHTGLLVGMGKFLK